MKRIFENLFVWQEARIVVGEIYSMFNESRDFGFKDQIQRACVSIMNNIAEGADSGSDAKFINYLNTSRGSCSEVRSMLYLCEDLGFCSPEKREELQGRVNQISYGLAKLIDTLQHPIPKP